MARRLNPNIFNEWVYEHIADYSKRIETYYGGAGSGKSVGATQKVYLKALNMPRKVLVIRKIQRTIKDSIWALFISHLHSSGLYSACRVNKSDYEIELPNGSIFLFKGLDDPEKIKSIDGITDIVIEEATELTEDDFTQLTGLDVQSLKTLLTKTETEKLWEELRRQGLDKYVKGNYKARISRL